MDITNASATKDQIEYALELKDSNTSSFKSSSTLSPSSSLGLIPVLSRGAVVERPVKLWNPRTYSGATWALLCNQLTFVRLSFPCRLAVLIGLF